MTYKNKGLGFVAGPDDERDHVLRASIQKLTKPRTKGNQWWQNLMRLDQGEEGACVGFGHTQNYNSSPRLHQLDNDYALDVYRQATLRDEWPNENWETMEGTSVRAGAKEMRRRGLISAYAFTYDVEEIAVWILNKGPVVLGCDWHTGMDNPTSANDYYITPTGKIRGGHCLVLDGVRWRGDSLDYFRPLNNWGAGWGDDGRCKIIVPNVEKLLNRDSGVACTWVEAA